MSEQLLCLLGENYRVNKYLGGNRRLIKWKQPHIGFYRNGRFVFCFKVSDMSEPLLWLLGENYRVKYFGGNRRLEMKTTTSWDDWKCTISCVYDLALKFSPFFSDTQGWPRLSPWCTKGQVWNKGTSFHLWHLFEFIVLPHVCCFSWFIKLLVSLKMECVSHLEAMEIECLACVIASWVTAHGECVVCVVFHVSWVLFHVSV